MTREKQIADELKEMGVDERDIALCIHLRSDFWEFYWVLTDEEANEKCASCISESLTNFSASFLADETGLDKSVFEALNKTDWQARQDAIECIIKSTCGMESFIKAAIAESGRGFFLSTTGDNHEGEITYNDTTYYIYRRTD